MHFHALHGSVSPSAEGKACMLLSCQAFQSVWWYCAIRGQIFLNPQDDRLGLRKKKRIEIDITLSYYQHSPLKSFVTDLMAIGLGRGIEAVAQRCFVKRWSLKFCKIHRKTPVPGSVQVFSFEACNFIWGETLAQVFSCEFYEISGSTLLHRATLVAGCFCGYLGQREGIRQIWEETESFGNSFCVIFDCYYSSLVPCFWKNDWAPGFISTQFRSFSNIS